MNARPDERGSKAAAMTLSRGSELENLEVWQEARIIRNGLHALAQTFPEHERSQLGLRMVNLSRRVTGQIARGLGAGLRSHECLACLRKARSSLYEILDCLDTANSCRVLTMSDCRPVTLRIQRCASLLSNYLRFLEARTREEG